MNYVHKVESTHQMVGEEGGGSGPCSAECHLKFNCKERTRKLWGQRKLV